MSKEMSDLSGYHDCHDNGNAFSQYKAYVELVNHRKVQLCHVPKYDNEHLDLGVALRSS